MKHFNIWGEEITAEQATPVVRFTLDARLSKGWRSRSSYPSREEAQLALEAERAEFPGLQFRIR